MDRERLTQAALTEILKSVWKEGEKPEEISKRLWEALDMTSKEDKSKLVLSPSVLHIASYKLSRNDRDEEKTEEGNEPERRTSISNIVPRMSWSYGPPSPTSPNVHVTRTKTFATYLHIIWRFFWFEMKIIFHVTLLTKIVGRRNFLFYQWMCG